MSITTMLAAVPREWIAWLLLGVLIFAAIALLCCALAGYIDAWRDAGDDPPDLPDLPDLPDSRTTQEASLFVSDWFFYLNALLCFVSMLGLIFCL